MFWSVEKRGLKPQQSPRISLSLSLSLSQLRYSLSLSVLIYTIQIRNCGFTLSIFHTLSCVSLFCIFVSLSTLFYSMFTVFLYVRTRWLLHPIWLKSVFSFRFSLCLFLENQTDEPYLCFFSQCEFHFHALLAFP